ncbi:tail fiber protein [Escherichia phage vB_Eco_Sip]|uniref:Tail fiber protein n=1 Tax=Escherichia phage vB_Eco_Sip TaxID=2831640 RepID=A0AAD1V8E0_9CAUD|nr:tail fiber protein [Escherichia phage vB_Eco_Sip]
MAIYRQGQASMDAQGYVTGYDTKWREQLTLIRPGATIFFLTQPLQAAVITEVISDTSIRAITTGGEVVQQTNYLILLHDSLTIDGLAQDVAETLRYYQSKETEIAEAIEFFKDFDLDGLKDLVNQVKESAQQVATDRAATEQLKNDTQQIKDSALAETQKIKDDAVSETNAIKNEAQSIKDQTQQIKDSAVVEVTSIKSEAESARDGAINAKNEADNAKNYAESAKSAAESARDEAMQWAQQVNPENILHKDQNLNDLTDKAEARKVLQVQAVISNDPASHSTPGDYNSFTNPQASYELRIANNGEWRVASNSDNATYALSIGAGGTGATTPDGVRHNLGLATNHIPVFLGVNLDNNNGEASGILYLRNKNAEGVQLSYSRVYNEIIGGTAKATIQVTREGGDTNYYQFDESGNAINYNTITIGRGIINSLGSNSLVIGDSDTGFKQGGDGVLQVFCNGRNVASFDPQNFHLNGLLNIWPIDNNANGIRVSGSRIGGGNALIGGQVSGGGFVDWRDRAAGLLVELPGDDAASNVFKAVRWGGDWVAGLDVVRYSSGSCDTRFNVRGAIYSFNDAGYASCVQWVSTSDIRLKANLKEIKSAKDKVKSIKGYTYFKRNNIDEDEHSLYSEEAGVIAQDVQNVLPEAVYKISDSDYLGVSYSGVTALLVNAINEMIYDSDRQEELIKKQQEEIEMLKSEINEIRNLISKLSDK